MTSDPRLASPDAVLVYGLDTCDDTTRARAAFDAAGFAYRYVNYDLEPAAKALVHGAGYTHTPVVVLPGGTLFIEPSDDELAGIVAGDLGLASPPWPAASDGRDPGRP